MKWFFVALGAFFFMSAVNLYDGLPRTHRKFVIPLIIISLILGFGMFGLAVLVHVGDTA